MSWLPPGIDDGAIGGGSLAEANRLRRIDDHIWNYLGLRDPDEIAAWIAGAVTEMALIRSKTEEK